MRNGWKRSIAVLLVFCVLCAAFPLGLESIAAAAADPAGMVGAASGKTGEVNWKLNGSTLTIYGEGKMEEDYGDLKYYKGPWKDYRKSIKSVVVDEGVTLVGQRAFHGCESLTSISIAESVEYVGGYAFEGTPWEMKSSAPAYAGKHLYYYKSSASQNGEFTVPDGTYSVSTWACGSCKFNRVVLPDSMGRIGSYAFAFCQNLSEIVIPNSLYQIDEGAFRDCSSLHEIYLPASVKKIGEKVFDGLPSDFTIYGFKGTEAQRYAKSHGIRFVEVIDEFIREHLAFIRGTGGNSIYRYGMDQLDNSEMISADNDELLSAIKAWRFIRGNWFDNPYDLAVTDILVSSNLFQSKLNGLKGWADFYLKDLADGVIEVIKQVRPQTSANYLILLKNYILSKATVNKPNPTLSEIMRETKVKAAVSRYFDEFSDLLKCANVAIDFANLGVDFYQLGVDVINNIVSFSNYLAMVRSYQTVDDDFKQVLKALRGSAAGVDSGLTKAIDDYTDEDKSILWIAKRLVTTVIKTRFQVTDFFLDNVLSDTLSESARSFLTSVSVMPGDSAFLACVAELKIGYDFGVAHANFFFNTDNVSEAYINTYVTAKTAQALKKTVEQFASAFENEQNIRNARCFCNAFTAFSALQENTAERMITYLQENNTSTAKKLCSLFGIDMSARDNSVGRLCRIWQTRKLNWEFMSCHGDRAIFESFKHLTIACPVDVTVSENGNEIIRIADERTNFCLKGCAVVRNGIKYITLPDGDYALTIHAVGSGVMSCSDEQESMQDEQTMTGRADRIALTAGATYTGTVSEGSEKITIFRNGRAVGTESRYSSDTAVYVSNVTLNSRSLRLAEGDTAQIGATVLPANASDKTLSWYSENEGVARVDEYGNVNAVAAGETVIVCESLGGAVEVRCTVKVTGAGRIGDVNRNGTVDIEDVTLIQRELAEYTPAGEFDRVAADTNGDGTVTVLDATHLQSYLAEFITDLSKRDA